MDNHQAAILQWQQQHPETTTKLRAARQHLDGLYCELLEEIAEASMDVEGEWDVREFIDSYGQRLVQLQHIVKTVFDMGGYYA